MPIILANGEGGGRDKSGGSLSLEIVQRDPISKIPNTDTQKGWWSDSSGRLPV
jgi:hypothetical protein